MDLSSAEKAFKTFLANVEPSLSLDEIFELVGLSKDYAATSNLLLKIQTFAKLLQLT